MVQKIQTYILNKESMHIGQEIRRKRLGGLNRCLQVGILFNATKEEDRGKIYRFKKDRLFGISTQFFTLGFIDNSLNIEDIEYSAFNKKNIDWLGRPKGKKVEDFLAQTFDILISFIDVYHIPSLHIINRCDARLKIGLSPMAHPLTFDVLVEGNCNEGLDRSLSNFKTVWSQITTK